LNGRDDRTVLLYPRRQAPGHEGGGSRSILIGYSYRYCAK
jgi:hypothetical protein